MLKPVIFCESPNKAPHIAEYSGMDCVATYGHFGDLPEKELGVDLHTYELTFEYKERIVQLIQRMAKDREVYVAGDPDREGFAISSMVAMFAERAKSRTIKLLEIHAIDKEGVTEAIAKAIPWDKANHNREKAFRGRRGVDRLVGYILSSFARAHFKETGWSVGRLQSPALRILVERARENQNFKPTEFWRVYVRAVTGTGPEIAFEYAGDRFKDVTTASALVAKLQVEGCTGRVTKVETRPFSKKPPTPFTMSTMTQAAEARFGLSIKEAANIAQALFEPGFITYPRSDSVRIEQKPLEAIRRAIEVTFGGKALPEVPNVHESKNSQADAHEAIRPTRIVPISELPGILEEIKKAGLGQVHCDLFTLIYLRTLASQMRPAQFDKTTVEAEFAGEIFKATGSVLVEEGFKKLYEDDLKDGQAEGKDEEDELPTLAEGQNLKKTSEELRRGETKPPAYHTEGTLVRELERMGIGRPSTYASAVEVLKLRAYAALGRGKHKKCLLPTEKGFALIDWLQSAHPWILDYAYTAELEAKLDQVEMGQLEFKAVLKEVHECMGFADPQNAPRIFAPRESFGQCPKCGGKVHEYAKFFGCENWPEDKGGCDFKIWANSFGGKITATVARDLLAGKRTRPVKLKSRAGKEYEAKLELSGGRVTPVFNQ